MDPKVHLISATMNPRAILKFCWDIINTPGFPANRSCFFMSDEHDNLPGIEVPDFDPKAMDQIVQEFCKSGLGGPLEMINFTFGFEGVTRAFTHQMVRTRLASYMQQSQRFTEFKDGLPVHKPSNIVDWAQKSEDGSTAEEVWDSAIKSVEWACAELQIMGLPTQDLRGLYPTNVTTNIIQTIDYNALRHMLSHRLCTQAQQEEWGPLARRIKELVTIYDPILGENLKPACQIKGRCDFDTSLDRPCEIRDHLKIPVDKSKLRGVMRNLVAYGGYDWAKGFLGDDVLSQIGDFGGEVTGKSE